jgi:hypothetical protein
MALDEEFLMNVAIRLPSAVKIGCDLMVAQERLLIDYTLRRARLFEKCEKDGTYLYTRDGIYELCQVYGALCRAKQTMVTGKKDFVNVWGPWVQDPRISDANNWFLEQVESSEAELADGVEEIELILSYVQ